MKNIFRFWMAVAIICGAVSCAKEDISSSLAGGEVEVTFTANLPELGTRAYADGANATLLRYWVYDASNGQELTALSNEVVGSGTFTFTLPLIKGMTYNFALWADKNVGTLENPQGLYDVNDGIVTVDYAKANDNNRDAFYGFVEGFDPLKSTPKFYLHRPFAQINAATSENLEDITANGLTLATSSIKAKVYTQFDIKACNVVDTSLEEVELTAEVMPYLPIDSATGNHANKLPGKETYTYLAMGYLLAPQDGMVSDVTFCFNGKKGGADFTVGGDKGLSYGNVPLKQNFRTNILGQLLTKSTEIEVEILPGFGIPDIEDYEEVAPGLCLINGNTYLITSLDGLKSFATFADSVTRSTINFKGKTVELAVDIDLENNPWTPINKFDGTFDGQGHTIKNVKIVAEGKAYAGFFANAQGTIKNLTLENVDIKGHYKAGAIVGNGLCSRINNCHVKNAYIKITPLNEDDGNHAGGIVGYLSAESEAYVTNCSVTDANIIAYRDCGGIAGTTTGETCSPVVKNNSLKDVYIVANQLDPYCDATKNANVGEVVGRNSKNIDLTDNTCDNVHADVLKKNAEGNIKISNIAGVSYFAELVDAGNTFAGETIKLENDIDASAKNWNPIGDNRTDDAAFSGIFDGQGHTINGAHISGDFCWNGAVYGSKEGWGLFSVLDGATVKNLKVDGAIFGSYTVISGVIAGYANDTTFENIDITNSKVAGYNWYTGGVVGWAQGECTFKGINLDNTVAVGSLWDSHGQNAGGIAGGVSASSKITIEDCNIACVLDVINDVTSNYKWYIYRVSGMIIGNTNTTETKYNEVVTATATNVTCKNVTVTYGKWMNYHYCEEYGNRGWGRVEESDYVGFGIPNEHTHSDGKKHYVCLPFDQLFGGSSNGSGHYPVKGLAEFPGVTVVYPAEYRREVSSATALTEALGKGLSVVLDADIDFGSTQLAITGENQVVDLGGHALTTANNWGGISLKNGATIKNGTITHAGNTAAIKAFNGTSVENVTINATCTTADKTVTGIAVQQGANIESIKNVTINGVSQGIEVGYQATVGLIENAVVNESNNGTAKGIGLVINGGRVGKAKDCTFKGETYGVTLHLKGVFDAGLELENCTVEGTTASINAWDEKGISNTSGSLVLTYDAATKLVGPFVWDFEDECQSVVTLNRPQ